MKKKGQMESIAVTLLIVGIIAIVGILAVSKLIGTLPDIDTTNPATAVLDENFTSSIAGTQLLHGGGAVSSESLVITQFSLTNASVAGGIVPTNNYTVTAAGLVTMLDTQSRWNNTQLNATYNYTTKVIGASDGTIDNVNSTFLSAMELAVIALIIVVAAGIIFMLTKGF